jgi:hypothetical protein
MKAQTKSHLTDSRFLSVPQNPLENCKQPAREIDQLLSKLGKMRPYMQLTSDLCGCLLSNGVFV